MKVNEENVIKEMESSLQLLKESRSCSTGLYTNSCIDKAIGKLSALIAVLSATKDD